MLRRTVAVVVFSLVAILASGCSRADNPKFAIEYGSMQYTIDTQENYNLKDYMINIKEYTELTRREHKEYLDKIRPLLNDTTYKSMVKGLNTDYFNAYCRVEYDKMYRNIQDMMLQMPYITDEFSSIKGIEKVNKCMVEDDRLAVQYITKYMRGSLRNLLIDTHYKYESLIKNYADDLKTANQDYIDMFYNEYLCKDTSHISDIEVTINQHSTIPGDTTTVSKKLGISNLEALKELDLYKCHNYYDSNIMSMAQNAMITFTVDNSFKPVYTRNGSFTLCGLNDKDKVDIDYTVDSATHTDIKSESDLQDYLTNRAKIYEAQLYVYDLIKGKIGDSKNSAEESHVH